MKLGAHVKDIFVNVELRMVMWEAERNFFRFLSRTINEWQRRTWQEGRQHLQGLLGPATSLPGLLETEFHRSIHLSLAMPAGVHDGSPFWAIGQIPM